MPILTPNPEPFKDALLKLNTVVMQNIVYTLSQTDRSNVELNQAAELAEAAANVNQHVTD